MNEYKDINVPTKNAAGEVVGNATVYRTGRIDILVDSEKGKQLFEMLQEGVATGVQLKADLRPNHPLNIEQESLDDVQLRCPIPRIAPIGIEVTKSGVKDAWESIITPMQEQGGPMGMEWRVIMAVMRTVYGAMPDDKE